ncbi:MAG: DUF2846 domain-containing protein [Sideroxyarcus sp.]|nr:DUF2846 domain-containing protein [Sideroxyarcus sp.]
MKIGISLKNLMVVATLAVLTGCASVPMAPKEQDAASKTFKAPASNMAGVYIYRNSFIGKALTKQLLIDGVVIGETANKVYFHREVTPGEHTLATQAEFGENALKFKAEAGKNYFFQQYIKMGTFKGSAGIQAVSEEEGKQNVLQCSEAK